MILEIHIADEVVGIDLNEISASVGNIITIGQKSKQIWNAIPIEDDSVDPFQCHLLRAGDSWQLHHGQVRTECPKGLLSSKTVPCNGCMGRCVNVHPGRPKYYQRNPEVATFHNGEALLEMKNVYLEDGDTIKMGNVEIRVKL